MEVTRARYGALHSIVRVIGAAVTSADIAAIGPRLCAAMP
jgi:hypothetical protein